MAVAATYDPIARQAVVPRGRLSTPRRLWAMLLVAVLALVLAGIVTGVQLSDRASGAAHTDQAVEALYTDVQDLSYSLADANAVASTAMVIGPVTPAALTARFGSDITQAEDLLSSASQRVAGDGQASANLQKLAEQIPEYSQWVGQALANNRFGYPVAGGYLREASAMLTGDMLPETNSVIDEEKAAMDAGLGGSSSVPIGAFLICIVAVVALWVVSVWLAATSKRRLNAGLLAALAALAFLFFWTLAATGARSSAADAAGGAESTIVGVQTASSRIALVEAYVALQQIDRGEDGGTDATSARDSSTGVADALGTSEPVNLPYGNAFNAATAASLAFTDCANTPIGQATSGAYQQAITSMVGSSAQHGEGGCIAKADAARDQLVNVFGQAQKSYDAAMASDSGAYAGSGALPLSIVAGLLGAAAAAWGINRRLAEYR